MLIKILICLLILIVIFAVGVIAFDSNRFVVREYSYETDKVSKDVCVIFLSDLHNKRYGKDNRRLINAIDKLHGDIILVGGDMMTAKGTDKYDNAVPFLKAVSGFGPFYYAFGNHESRARANRNDRYGNLFQRYEKAINDAGVILRDNDFMEYGDIRIYGLTIPEEFYYKKKMKTMSSRDVADCIGEPDKNKLNILLAHNPESFEGYSGWGADVVLSGHFHGGVVRLPISGKGMISPRFTLFPKYDGGLFTGGNTRMYISRGLGMHTIPFRMFNPGEILVLNIKKP